MSFFIASETEDVVGMPTGFEELDAMLGCGGLPEGRMTVITGPFSSGKTALALHLISQAQKQGKKTLFCDVERTFHKEQAKICGVDLEGLIVMRGAFGEEVLDQLEKWLLEEKKKKRVNEEALVVLDSYSFLSPRAEVEADNERKGMMEKSRMMAQHLRKMVNIVPETKCTYLVISHHYEVSIPGTMAKRLVLPGGDAMSKAPSVWLRIASSQIKEGSERVGTTLRIVQMKNKVGGSQGDECEIEYNFKKGFVV